MLAKLIIKTGLLDLLTDFPKYANTSVKEYLNNLTENERLRAVLSYSFGDYGTGIVDQYFNTSVIFHGY